MVSYLSGKSILITGGSGSIGESITKKALLDKAKLMGTFETVPERDEIPEPVNEQLVVELYSK